MYATLQQQQTHSFTYSKALDLFSSNHPTNQDHKSTNLKNKPKRIDTQTSNDESFQAKITKINPLPQLFNDNNFRLKVPIQPKSGHCSFLQTLKNLPRKMHNPSNIKVLLKTEYSVIHNLIHKYFNYKFYTKEDHSNDIFLIWVDTYVSEEFIKRLKSYQKINHFPNSCELGRKDLLAINLNRAKGAMPELYKFYPSTWVLPQDFQAFSSRTPSNSFYIIKPHANCQGRGIYLTKHPSVSSKDEIIIQEYAPNPMLIEGSKFDLRVYVMLRSLDPLRIYIYEQGLCRIATSKYEQPNEDNIRNDKMHLTNYAINKYATNFIGNKDIQHDNKGHKRSLTSAMKTLQAMGFNPSKIQERIDSIIVRSILSAYAKMLQSYKKTRESNINFKNIKDFINYKEEAHQYFTTDNTDEQSVCFELFGFDIMLLDTGQPILLQINHQPSLVTDSPLDLNVKRCLIMDTINLLNLEERNKENWGKNQKEGTPFKATHVEEKELEMAGGYRRIYPLRHIKLHEKSQGQEQSIRKHIELYQGMLNRIMFRQFKRLSKLKMSNYHTIGSRNNNRTFLSKMKEDNRNNLSAPRTDKQEDSHKKEIAVTFYNLFNHSKYNRESHGNGSNRPESEGSMDQKIIKNHILLQSIEKDRNIRHLEGGLVDLKPSLKREDFRLRKQEAIASKMTDFFNDKSIKPPPESVSSSLHTKINNKHIIHYMSTNQSKTNIMTDRNSPSKLKQKSNPQESSQKPESDKQIEPDKRLQYRQIYKNSIREKMQKINNLKILKNHLHKLNFVNFISRVKNQEQQEQLGK